LISTRSIKEGRKIVGTLVVTAGMAIDEQTTQHQGMLSGQKEKAMYPLAKVNADKVNSQTVRLPRHEPVKVESLAAEHEAEVMAFLGERPSHTFGLCGFIRSNGLVSPHNRGTFYACRDEAGQLQGVALIGHFILFETRSDAAIEAFARLAQSHPNAHMLLGEQDKVDAFWHYYADGGQDARLFCRELLLEHRWPVAVEQEQTELRLATIDDLDLIVPAHAQSAFDESGINPLDVDPEGFRQRCVRRIEQGRTWVWVDGGKLMFKAEVITDTPDVVYLEGVWVDPAERGKGHGLRCMSQMSRKLLMNTNAVCLLVNEKFQAAQRFYRKAGYKLVGYYDTIFLNRKTC
jgi:predicted GNAT family acetyltransferase